jgi:hypothetical protein
MRYKVPRHIDYKAKIVGPATFSQLLYIGVAGFIALVFYFLMGDSPFFMPFAILLGGGGVALAFVQIAGQPLPEYIKKMIIFSTSSREYVWEKKIVPMEAAIPRRVKTTPENNKEEDPATKAKTSKKRGNLGEMASKIETF